MDNPIGNNVPYQANPYDKTPVNETTLNINMPNDSRNFQSESVYDKAKSIYFESNGVLTNAEHFIYVDDPILEIAECKNAVVLQPVSLLEMASGCVTNNEYNVFLDSPKGMIYAYYFKEKSNVCCRNICSQAKRPFDMIANNIPSQKEIEHRVENPYFDIDRPCGCTWICCPCNCIRPCMTIKFSKTGQYLGKIYDTCSCCDKVLEVYDQGANLIYEIVTPKCQIAFCNMSNFCLCCNSNRMAEEVAEIRFKIIKDGRHVGNIIKIAQTTTVPASHLIASRYGMNDKSNSFIVNFPEDASPSYKLLLIIAAVKLGFQFFKANTTRCCCSCLLCCCCPFCSLSCC